MNKQQKNKGKEVNYKNYITKIKQDGFWFVASLSLTALFIAYSAELILKLQPCILCIYQRIPYFLILIISSLTIFRSNWRKISYSLIALLSIIEIGLALYHVGVEHHFFEEHYICQADHQIGNLLSTMKLTSDCSVINFKFMNFSMAEWNLIYAIGLLSYFIYREKKNGITW